MELYSFIILSMLASAVLNDLHPTPANARRFMARWSCAADVRHCGSFLWVYDSNYPELMHPFAWAIDTDLPKPPEHTHIMLDFAANWVEIPQSQSDYHQRYPKESIAQWHERLGLTNEVEE